MQSRMKMKALRVAVFFVQDILCIQHPLADAGACPVILLC